MEHFVAGTTLGVHLNTEAYYFQTLRELIAYHTEQLPNEVFSEEIEVDESYSGGSRKGKRGSGAEGKFLF